MKNHYLNTAILASLKAGNAIMEIYDKPFKVEYKSDQSPLTIADKNANEIINSFLIPTDISIISEENKQIDYDIRKNWRRCWVVDPVDGTKEFVKKNGEFTVNIALVENGQPILGVIYVPANKTLYFGDVIKGRSFKAELNSHDESLERIFKISTALVPNNSIAENIQVVGSRSHMNQDTTRYIEHLESEGKKVEIVSKGSSLKFCLVAEGSADVYPRFAPTMEWDTAAGQAICNAVGVEVIDQETNLPLAYNKENLLNSYFLVS